MSADSSQQQPPRGRGLGRPWPKGFCPNPGGRPKGEGEVAKLARQHGPEAIDRLVEWMRSDNARASVAAALALLERGYGRPREFVELTGANGGPIQHQEVVDDRVPIETYLAEFAKEQERKDVH